MASPRNPSQPHPHPRPAALPRAVPPLALFVFAVALLYPLTLRGESLYWGDIWLYFYPLETYVQEQLKSGAIPLWNPYVLCGQPLVGNPQSWVFYPTTLLLGIMPVWLYFTVNTLLHLFLAGLGTYLFMRRLCHDRLAALLSGLTYMGSGFLMARLQFPTMVMSAAWLPWMLLLVDRVIERPSVGYASLLTLVVALEILAAHTQLAYLSLLCAILYSLARLWQIRRHRLRCGKAFASMAGSLGAGFMGALVYLLPALQLFVLSTREKLTWVQANRFVLLPEQLVNFLLPTFYGHPANADYWGGGNFWEPCVYLGVVPLVLALYAAFRAARRPAARFFAVLGFVALWLSMGRFGGIYWVAYSAFPGMKSFHDPARFTYITTFCFAALAGFGLRALRDLPGTRVTERTRIALTVVAAVNLWAFSSRINPTLKPDAFGYRPRVMAVVPRRGEGRVFTAFRDQVWKRTLNYSDYGPRTARYAHELTDTLPPNIGMRLDVEEGSGYEPVPLKTTSEVDSLVRYALERQAPNLPMLLRLFNARLIALPELTRYRHAALEPVEARGVTALAVREPTPRMWLVRQTFRVDGSQRTLAALGEPEFDTASVAIISGSGGLGERFGPPLRQPNGTLSIEESGPQFVRVTADAGPEPAFLVWSESWYPGWRAAVDGRTRLVERANHAFQGVVVPPGRHRIEFTYRPVSYLAGLYGTMLFLAAVCAGITYGAAERKTRRRIGPASGLQGEELIPLLV